MKSLIRSGEDLIAKEAGYHKSCPVLFLKETDEQDKSTQRNTSYHKKAFSSALPYIKNEVIGKQRSVLVRDLSDMQKEEYSSLGGHSGDLQADTIQNLTRKIKDHLKENITIRLADQQKGNFIYCSTVSEEDARA